MDRKFDVELFMDGNSIPVHDVYYANIDDKICELRITINGKSKQNLIIRIIDNGEYVSVDGEQNQEEEKTSDN